MPRMIGRLVLGLAVLAACSSPPAPPAAPAPRVVREPPPEDERGELVDEAVIVMSVGGKRLAREHYSIYRSDSGWALASEQTFGGQSPVELAGVLLTDPAFRPEKGVWEGKIGGKPFSIGLARTPAGKLQKTTRMGDDQRVEDESRTPELYVADNTAVHMAVLCIAAGESAGEKLVFPGVPVKYSAPAPRVIDGKPITVREVDFGGVMAFTLVCEGDKLRGLRAPFADFLAVREGDEALLAALEVEPRDKPALPDTLVELARTVKAPADGGLGDAQLSCSLVVPRAYENGLPKKAKRLPAVVFVTGSGPQDRDEDSIGAGGLKMAIFKTMAITFGEAGIASLRCDDLGTGASTGDFAKGTRQSFTSLVAAEIAALRGEAAIDPARIGLVGHSEGGYLAPLVALLDPKLRALVLMAAPARPLDAILIEQIENGMRSGGSTQDNIDREIAKVKRVFVAWRAGVKIPADVPEAEREAWEKQAPWFQSYLDHDPLLVPEKLVRIAVFVAQGDADQQVPAAEADLLAGALARAGNKKAQVKRYPGLNHLFFKGKTGTFSDYADPEAVVDAGFLADAVTFLKKHL
jgi:pimeloyl-ACP methyl ester carboxylesterase